MKRRIRGKILAIRAVEHLVALHHPIDGMKIAIFSLGTTPALDEVIKNPRVGMEVDLEVDTWFESVSIYVKTILTPAVASGIQAETSNSRPRGSTPRTVAKSKPRKKRSRKMT